MNASPRSAASCIARTILVTQPDGRRGRHALPPARPAAYDFNQNRIWCALGVAVPRQNWLNHPALHSAGVASLRPAETGRPKPPTCGRGIGKSSDEVGTVDAPARPGTRPWHGSLRPRARLPIAEGPPTGETNRLAPLRRPSPEGCGSVDRTSGRSDLDTSCPPQSRCLCLSDRRTLESVRWS